MANERETRFVRVARRVQRYQWPEGLSRPVRLLIAWAVGLPVVMFAGWVFGSVGISDAVSPGQGGTTGAIAAALGWTVATIWLRKPLTD